MWVLVAPHRKGLPTTWQVQFNTSRVQCVSCWIQWCRREREINVDLEHPKWTWEQGELSCSPIKMGTAWGIPQNIKCMGNFRIIISDLHRIQTPRYFCGLSLQCLSIKVMQNTSLLLQLMLQLIYLPPPPFSQHVEDEDLINAIKGFSTVTKEHTSFTDTHL